MIPQLPPDILQRARAGDAGALGAVYSHYAPPLLRFIRRQVGDEHLAEDLLQETFCCVCRDIGSYADRGHPFSTWLYQVARSRIIDAWRKERRRPTVELRRDIATEGPEAHIEGWDTAERVRGALDSLNSKQRAVLLLRFALDKSLDETGAALNLSRSAVKALQHRAVGRLERELTTLAGADRSVVDTARVGTDCGWS